MKHDFDLVVVGGGLAGLVAAVRVAEAGFRVLVAEKSTEIAYGCNSRYGSGALHLAFSDMAEDPKDILANMQAAAREDADPQLLEAIAKTSRGFVDWLLSLGVRFEKGGPMKHRNWVLTPQRAQVGGVDWQDRGGDRLLATLESRLSAAGGELRRGATARSLITDRAGACCGVQMDVNGESCAVTSAAVVLADGGFAANRALAAKHLTADVDSVVMRNAGANHGDALSMATEIGAGSVGLNAFYGHVMHSQAAEKPLLSPYPFMDFLAVRTIMVTDDGQRFVDEGAGGIFIANTMARDNDRSRHTVILDADCWETHGRERIIPPNPNLEAGGGTIHVADTLEELAAHAGLDPKGLCDTVRDYNQAVRTGTPDTLSPPRSAQPNTPHLIEKPPFRAIPARAGLSYSMGGLATTADCRVLHREGHWINGLFAAGDALGGIEGGAKKGYVGGLALAGITATLAADAIVEDLKRAETTASRDDCSA